ncbi:MAG: nucleotidyltransferase domain-containing protein, partial [Litorivicinus sp.]
MTRLLIEPTESGKALAMLLPGIELVYLFGSFADGSATAASDVDVAFLSSEKIDALVRYTAAQKLANQLNR